MKKNISIYICQSCHFKVQKWFGKCPMCQSWNSFEEEVQTKGKVDQRKYSNGLDDKNTPVALTDVSETQLDRLESKIIEFDRVLGGGLVSGSVTLLAGDPGVGKSTLIACLLEKILSHKTNEIALYISGEESINQVAQRMRRIGVQTNQLLLFSEKNWQEIKKHIMKLKPRILIIDSIQTIYSDQLETAAGTISQIKEVSDEMIVLTKKQLFSSVVIGHITKEGGIAGPKTLEHMVDTVLYLEHSQSGEHRILRALKNRYGPTTEIGIFEMCQRGIREMNLKENQSEDIPLSSHYGRTITATVEGSRVLSIEAQSLVNENKYGQGKRFTTGFDLSRLQMLIAVMEKFLKLKLQDYDIYVNTIGLATKISKSCDLSIVSSILSSLHKINIKSGIVFIGEIGLCGEIRPAYKDRIIVEELIKLNYKKIIVSSRTMNKIEKELKSKCHPIDHVSEMTKFLRTENENISPDK